MTTYRTIVFYLSLALLAAMIVVSLWLMAAPPAGAADLRDHRCNPYTYGRPHSCHVAPVQFVGNTSGSKCVVIDGRLVCFTVWGYFR